MPKVLIADKLAEEGIDILKKAGFIVDCNYGLSEEELKAGIKEYDAIIVRSQTKLTEKIIKEADNLKIIGRAGVGVDNVDVNAATKKGIIVMNAPSGNTISTCEHTFALLLALARKIPWAYNSLCRGEWERARFKGVELYSKVLGIIGLGRIGKEVAKRALAFGMKVLGYDPYILSEVADKLGIKLVELNELLRRADFITIHTPLTPQTKNLISQQEFSLMKPTVFLINCARGGIIDESALYQALKEKRIAGCALDVFEEEPPVNSKVLNLDNVVATPHLGATTSEAQVSVAIEIATCVRDALLGRAIRNAVNYVPIEPEVYKIIRPFIKLCELMGSFASQVIEGRAKEITISYMGEIASFKVDPLADAFIKGFLSHILEEDVSFVNAIAIAKSRGIKIEQRKIREEEEYVNSIRVKIVTEKEEKSLEGTLFANKEPRLVKINEFHIEVSPSNYMVVVYNWDKPGVIGSLGTILANHKVNIAAMSLGRSAPSGVAVTILNVDTPLREEVKKEILANPNIISLKEIKLNYPG